MTMSLRASTGSGRYAVGSATPSTAGSSTGPAVFAYAGGSKSPYASASPFTLPDTARLGYAAGAGIEFALTERIAVKVEGLYVDLGKQRAGTTVYGVIVPAYDGTDRSGSDFGVVRGGLNDRF